MQRVGRNLSYGCLGRAVLGPPARQPGGRQSQHSCRSHVLSEIDEAAVQVASVQHPDAVPLGPIQDISTATIQNIIDSFPQALFAILGGPPCQDVSLLSGNRAGADGPRSGLREEFARIYHTFEALTPPGAVFGLMECTRMSRADREAYDRVFGNPPVDVCARHFSPCTRGRLWWSSHSPFWPEDVRFRTSPDGIQEIIPPRAESLFPKS